MKNLNTRNRVGIVYFRVHKCIGGFRFCSYDNVGFNVMFFFL